MHRQTFLHALSMLVCSCKSLSRAANLLRCQASLICCIQGMSVAWMNLAPKSLQLLSCWLAIGGCCWVLVSLWFVGLPHTVPFRVGTVRVLLWHVRARCAHNSFEHWDIEQSCNQTCGGNTFLLWHSQSMTSFDFCLQLLRSNGPKSPMETRKSPRVTTIRRATGSAQVFCAKLLLWATSCSSACAALLISW